MLQTANSMAEKEYMCCQITAMGINDNDMAICHFLKESPNLKIPSSNKGAITNNTINIKGTDPLFATSNGFPPNEVNFSASISLAL